MRQYFYDGPTGNLIAFDVLNGVPIHLEILRPLTAPIDASPEMNTETVFVGGGASHIEDVPETKIKRKYTKVSGKPLLPKEPSPTGKRTVTCRECGEKGHTAKTCGKERKAGAAFEIAGNQAWKKLGSSEHGTKRNGVMTQDKYEQVKMADRHGITPDVIANEMHVPKKEVQKALIAASYDDYAA